ncbi:hypothetical protein GQ37_014130 [Janthinobacterium sp. BJB1]|uniref:hypothetical protein n=1 Tax=Janthinobacterium sp. GW458P TaxID=1981504 RepID=UPI000A326A0C|nr:hypothetical protein [Janthinobacterium sp. GW458P]MBE3024345.1 hypothetical protein [Janthinobacterium sp. GW458P]PJC98192.1 hypothetical protein GQ37_014130 [Janthinobacterium sp. BJB1]
MSTALLDRVGAASGAFSGITRLYELKLEAAARRMRARCWWKRSPATSNCRRLVNGKAVCGFFRDAGKIKDGDIVKLLVTQRKDVLYVHSLLCIGDSLFF